MAVILYGMFFAVAFFVPGGGQINTAFATCAVVWAILTYTTSDLIEKTPGGPISQWERVPIFEGYIIMNAHVKARFDTYDPMNHSYRRLVPSMNRMGGSQFSYSFWLNFGGALDDSITGKTLFLRGDKRLYAPTVRGPDDLAFERYFKDAPEGRDITVACPRVYFKAANMLGVQINTDRDLIFEAEVGTPYANQELRQNLLSLIPRHWALITIVFEDNIPINDFENGVAIKTYVNDLLYDTSVAPGAMRQNNGPFHVLMAEQWPPESRMSDLIYYNYALSDNDVRKLYNKGPNTNPSDDMPNDTAMDDNDKLILSPYNKVDKTNYGTNLSMLQF